MNIGGFQKSLVNLLSYFDYSQYEVDLFLIERNGVFENEISTNVNIIYADEQTSAYCQTLSVSLKSLLSLKKYGLVVKRILNAIIGYMNKGLGAVIMSKQLPNLANEYYCCIDYCGQYLNYYMIDKVSAKIKITYFHNDYAKWDYYKLTDKFYYKKADYIVTVSEHCVESLKKYFPSYSKKIKCIENIITVDTISPYLIDPQMPTEFEPNKIKLVSVGRLVQDKGTDLAIQTCSILANEFDIQWIWVGPGNKDFYYKLAKDYGVENDFIMVGGQDNPYKYMAHADIVVHPARFEGKAVAVEEALVMNKVIVATNYSTAHNQIMNGETGIICDMNPSSIYQSVKNVINDKNLREKILNNQRLLCKGNANEIHKLYDLLKG